MEHTVLTGHNVFYLEIKEVTYTQRKYQNGIETRPKAFIISKMAHICYMVSCSSSGLIAITNDIRLSFYCDRKYPA